MTEFLWMPAQEWNGKSSAREKRLAKPKMSKGVVVYPSRNFGRINWSNARALAAAVDARNDDHAAHWHGKIGAVRMKVALKPDASAS
jgi:hypothetical protein